MFSVVCTIWIMALSAAAQAPSSTDNDTRNSNVDARTMPVPAPAVTSANGDDFAQSVTFESAALVQDHPGVFLQHPQPQTGSLSLRGQNGDRNIIRVDGIRYDNGLYGTFPNQTLSTIGAPFIAHMAIRRGPQSFFFANGGNGSVIDIRLTNPTEMTPGIHGGGGFYYSTASHTPGVMVNAASVRDTHSFALGANYLSLGEIRAGNGDKLPFTDSQEANWLAKVILQPEDSPVVVTGGYMGHVTDGRARTDQLGLGTIQLYDNSDNLVYINVGWKPKGPVRKINILASYHQMVENGKRYHCHLTNERDRINLPACRALGIGTTINARKTQDTVDTFGIDASSELALYRDRLYLLGNLEYYFDNIISSMDAAAESIDRAGNVVPPTYVLQNRGLYSSGASVSKFGTSLGINANPLRTPMGDLWIQLGGRLSHFAAYAPMVPAIEEDIHYTHSGFTDTATILWAYRDYLTLFGSWATGIRSPSLQETTAEGYINSEYQVPKVDLDAELSTRYETGIWLSLKPVRLGAVWFYNRIDNYIDERPGIWEGYIQRSDGTNIVERYNADDAVLKGIENTIEFQLGDFSLFGTLTWQKGAIHQDTTGYMAAISNHARNYPVRKIPGLFGTAGLKYTHPNDRFFAAILMDWADAQTRLHPLDKRELAVCESGDHTGRLKTDCDRFAGYYTFGVQGGVQISPNADMVLSLQNLLDRNYQTIGSTQREPGFDARTMIRLHF